MRFSGLSALNRRFGPLYDSISGAYFIGVRRIHLLIVLGGLDQTERDNLAVIFVQEVN